MSPTNAVILLFRSHWPHSKNSVHCTVSLSHEKPLQLIWFNFCQCYQSCCAVNSK